VLGLVALIGLAFITNRPMKADDGRAEERTRMAEAMVAREQFDEAEALGDGSGADPSASGHASLPRRPAAPRAPTGQASRSITSSARSRSTRPVAIADYAIGQALLGASRPKEAIPHLEAALKAGVQADLAGFDLARARAAIGDRAGRAAGAAVGQAGESGRSPGVDEAGRIRAAARGAVTRRRILRSGGAYSRHAHRTSVRISGTRSR